MLPGFRFDFRQRIWLLLLRLRGWWQPWQVEHRWSETTAKVAVRQAWPTSATVSLHFLQISDSHITLSPLSGQEVVYGKRMHDAFYGGSPCLWNRSTVQTAPMFRELVDVAASAAVDAVLLSGDIVSFPQASAVDTVSGLLNETMRYKCGPQQGRRIPHVFTSGNHDWFLEGLPGSQPELQRTWRSALRPLYVSSATWGDYPQFDYSSMEVEGVLLVVIDNSRYQVTHEQLAFFREQMLRWLPTFRIPFGTDLWNWCPVQPWPCGEVLPNSASESQEALEVASELRFMAHFVKVKDLTPSSLNVDLIVKVLASDGRLQCLSGAGLQLACVTVGDETGTVMLRLAAQQARLCEPGATLVLRSARAEMFAGQVRLELGRWSRVSALGDAALFAPKIQNDVSSKEYAVDQSQILNCQRQSREVLVLHVPLSLTDSLRPHRGFVLCGDPAWGEATDRSWRDERRDPWPKEGNDRATELFLEAVQAAAAPAGPLLAVLTGHTHGHDATVFGRSEEAGHESSSSDTVPSAVQYICEPSMRGGHRFLNVVLTSAEGPGESRDRKAESLKIVLPDSAISTPVNSMLEHGPTCSIIDMMCDLVYGTSKPEAQLILMKQVPVFSNERGQIERLTQEGRKLRRIQTCYEAWSRNKLQPSSWRSNPTALRRHSCCEPVISVLARLDMPWQCPLVPFAQCPSCESTKAQHSVPEPLGVTLSKRTAAHDLLLGLTWAAMKTAYEESRFGELLGIVTRYTPGHEGQSACAAPASAGPKSLSRPGEDPEIEHDLAMPPQRKGAKTWRCWGGIKNLEAAAAGIELTAVADGIDAVLHRTTEAVRAGLVLVAHGLPGAPL
ncbi:Uncharacterized protein AK812_SmicGene35003, partial [Symbiodinium microadriaticum]